MQISGSQKRGHDFIAIWRCRPANVSFIWLWTVLMLLESVSILISNCKKKKKGAHKKIETKLTGIIKESDCDLAVTLLTLKFISHLDDLPSYLVGFGFQDPKFRWFVVQWTSFQIFCVRNKENFYSMVINIDMKIKIFRGKKFGHIFANVVWNGLIGVNSR